MQNHAADQLNIEMSLAKRAFRSLSDGRERRREQIVERRAFFQLFTENLGAGPQLVIGERLNFAFQLIDRRNAAPETLDLSLVGRTEDFRCEATEREHIEIRPKKRRPPARLLAIGLRLRSPGAISKKCAARASPPRLLHVSLGTSHVVQAEPKPEPMWGRHKNSPPSLSMF
jgi:hypothetical protein